MAEQLDVQGLIVLTEGDRFVTIGRGRRARVWRIDLTGEPVEDVDRTGTAGELVVDGVPQPALFVAGHMVCADHRPVQHRDGKPRWCDSCRRSLDGIPVEQLPGLGDDRG